MGGTIDKLYFDDLSRYEVGDPQVAEVLKEAEVHFDYEIEDVVRKDSLRLTETDRELLRQRIAASPHRLALVTHGTDTMVETAREMVERGAARQTAAAEPDSCRIGRGCLEVKAEAIPFSQNGVRWTPDRQRLTSLGDRDGGRDAGHGNAVADLKGDLRKGAGRVKPWRPSKRPFRRIEVRAGR